MEYGNTKGSRKKKKKHIHYTRKINLFYDILFLR